MESMSTAKQIADRLRSAIEKDPRTQQQIADACELSKPLISKFMSDKDKAINLDTACRLADGLGLKLTLK
jgi:transcriptional regulator with XRE-family HTH domain